MRNLAQAFGPYQRRVFLYALLSICSAILLLLIFPKFDLRFLAPVALTPLLFVMARTNDGWQRFAFGWAAGIFYWFFLCTWIQFVLEVHGGMGRWGGWASFLLFAILKGIHLGLFSCFAGPIMRTPYAVPAVAALWTGIERTHGTFGFAWLDLGNAGIDMSLPLRVAPFVGVYGVSFTFAMLAGAVACVLLRYPRRYLAPLPALALLWALPTIREGAPAGDQALLIQPNIDPEIQWTSLLQLRTEKQLTFLSNAIAAPLVIWPELPAPLYFYSDPDFREDAFAIAQRHGDFIFGTVAYTPDKHPLNSAVLVGANGKEIGRYDKIDLVPFGEFVPPLFGWVNRITDEVSDFVPGHDIKVLGAARHRFGVFICYESAFPDLVRQFSKQGADVLVNISNDGYFGHTEAREQHLLLVRMRAVESRRFVVRSTNDGITAVIDPAGRIRKMLPPYHQVAAVVSYGGVSAATFYARHGDWFAWTCLVVGVGLALNKMRRRASAERD
ncbi:MAG: apolipoprotein N-acyltransferase [Acidobacteriaceae bacterium]|nr:apolipoprotein N-acyltransferase [Acidobacteriaceae bacterium]